jgi:hypothetical protein
MSASDRTVLPRTAHFLGRKIVAPFEPRAGKKKNLRADIPVY